MISKFFKDFTDHRKKPSKGGGGVLSDGELSQTFLNPGATDETFQHSFGHILKISPSIYKSPGSQFFRTTIGIQSGLNVIDESMLVMTFLNNLGLAEMSYNFRLLLEGKQVKRYQSYQVKSS